MSEVFVSNLSYDTTVPDLEQLAAQFGQIVSVVIPTDRSTGKPRGFAFIKAATKREAATVIAGLNEFKFQGRRLYAEESKPRGER